MLQKYNVGCEQEGCFRQGEPEQRMSVLNNNVMSLLTKTVCVKQQCDVDVKQKCDMSVHFRMISMRLEKPICAPPRLSEVSPTLPLKRFQCSSD